MSRCGPERQVQRDRNIECHRWRGCFERRGTRTAPNSISALHKNSRPHIVRLGMATTLAPCALAVPGPPASTTFPLTVRSSSPSAPSVIVNVAVWPEKLTLFAAPNEYQWAAIGPGVGPYFQYFSPAAKAVGNVTCSVIVPAQPVVENWNSPSVKLTPAGGAAGGPTSDAVANEHVEPPPESIAVATPELVDVVPLKVVTPLAARFAATV